MIPPSSSLSIWACSAAGLLLILASALILSPRLLLFLAQTQRTELTSLEAFLAIHFGVYLVAVAIALILNVGGNQQHLLAVPLLMHLLQTPEATSFALSERNNERSHPLLVPVTIASNLLAFISWNTRDVGALATVTFVINAVIGIWGLWTVSGVVGRLKQSVTKQVEDTFLQLQLHLENHRC